MLNEEKPLIRDKLQDNTSLFYKIFLIPIVSLIFVPIGFLILVLQDVLHDPSLTELAPKSYYDVRLFFAFPFILLGHMFEHFTSPALIIALLGVGLLSLVIGGIGVRILVQRIRAQQSILGVAFAAFIALLPVFFEAASLIGFLFLYTQVSDDSLSKQGVRLFEDHVHRPVPPQIKEIAGLRRRKLVVFSYSGRLKDLSFLDEWRALTEEEIDLYPKHSYCGGFKEGNPIPSVYAKGTPDEDSNLNYSHYLCFDKQTKKGALFVP